MSKKKSNNLSVEHKSTGVAAVEATEKLGTFLSSVFGAPITTTSGMLQDKLAVARWERQLRLADKVQEITNERAASGKPVGVQPRLAVPIIENASLEENNQLQDLWAHLLASAMNTETSIKVRNAFVDIIKQLEPIDVQILEVCFKKLRESQLTRKAKFGHKEWFTETDATSYPITQKHVIDALDITKQTYMESADNLMRVRLLSSYIEDSDIHAEVDGSEEYYEASLHYGYQSVCITELGTVFVKVCTPSSDEEDEEELLIRLKKEHDIKMEQRESAREAALKKIQDQLGSGAIVFSEDADKKL